MCVKSDGRAQEWASDVFRSCSETGWNPRPGVNALGRIAFRESLLRAGLCSYLDVAKIQYHLSNTCGRDNIHFPTDTQAAFQVYPDLF